MKFIHDRAKKKLRFFPSEGAKAVVVLADNYTHPWPKCGKPAPLELRQTANGVVYDQPYCSRN